MPNHSQGNGRNVALPDEMRPSWRPQDEQGRNRRNLSEEDDRYEDDRYMRHWEDRDRRDWDRDERYDRSFQSRNQGYPGSFEDRYRDRERTDDRWSGRGGSSYYDRGYNPERYGAQGGYGGGRGWEAERIGIPRGYGYDDGDRDRDRVNLGTGGQISGNYPQHGQRVGSGHRGKGPSTYHRSDDRIREIICEALTEDDRIDATHIEVSVKNGEVTLSGTVEDRQMKRLAEDRVEGLGGVKDVQNLIRIASK